MKFIHLLMFAFIISGCGTESKSGNNNIQPENPVYVAEVLMHEGQFAKAKKVLTSYLQTIPTDWQPRFVQNGRQKIHYWDEHTVEVCKKIDQEKTGLPVDAIIGQSYSKAYFILAFIAVEEKNYKLANQYLDKALVFEPDHPGLISEKAVIMLEQRNFQLKESLYRKVIESENCVPDLDRARAYRGLGVVLIDLERLDEAETALYESLKYEGNHPLAINELNYIDKLRNGGRKQQLKLTNPLDNNQNKN